MHAFWGYTVPIQDGVSFGGHLGIVYVSIEAAIGGSFGIEGGALLRCAWHGQEEGRTVDRYGYAQCVFPLAVAALRCKQFGIQGRAP